MAKEILDQLWEKFELTKDPRLLAEAVMDAEFGRQTQLQQAIADFILEHRRTAAYDRHVRNDSFWIMHQANLKNGLSANDSYQAISDLNSKLDKSKKLNTVSVDAIRKAIKSADEIRNRPED